MTSTTTTSPDELKALARVPAAWEADGARYRVGRMTPADLGELNGWLKAHTPSPMARVKAALAELGGAATEEVRLKLVELAWAEPWPPSVDDPRGMVALVMGAGRAHFLHVALRRTHPEVTAPAAEALAERVDFDQFNRLVALAFGQDPDDPKGAPSPPTS